VGRAVRAESHPWWRAAAGGGEGAPGIHPEVEVALLEPASFSSEAPGRRSERRWGGSSEWWRGGSLERRWRHPRVAALRRVRLRAEVREAQGRPRACGSSERRGRPAAGGAQQRFAERRGLGFSPERGPSFAERNIEWMSLKRLLDACFVTFSETLASQILLKRLLEML